MGIYLIFVEGDGVQIVLGFFKRHFAVFISMNAATLKRL